MARHAAEQSIRHLAVQQERRLAGGALSNCVVDNHFLAGDGILHPPDELGQQLGQILRRKNDLAMSRAEVARGFGGKREVRIAWG